MRFAHLSVHSTFSLRDGTMPPERIAAAAAEAGMAHVALTDRDGLSGAVRFVRAARSVGVAPVLGVDLAVDPLAKRPGDAPGGDRRADRATRRVESARVTLLACDELGLGDLCATITRAHANDRSSPSLRPSDLELATRSGRVIALLGAASPVGMLLARGAPDAAAQELQHWRERFGPDGTALGVRDHRVAPGRHRLHGRPDPDEPGDDARIARTLALAGRSGVQAVAVNDVRHERPADVRLADVLRCMRLGVPLAAHHLGRSTSAAWFTDPATQARRFAERPDLIAAAADLAERCGDGLRIGGVTAPRLSGVGADVAARTLRERASAGLLRRSGTVGTCAQERLAHEFDAIDAAGLHDLFLAVADIVADIRARGILVACRGSAAGSLVCFALGISDVDPLLHGLSFERFMNPYRDELPDIDLDVESHRREEIYRLIIERYGESRVACVGMFETYQARSAIREVGKVLGLPGEEVAHLSERLPSLRGRDVRRALDRLPELAGARLDTGRLALLLDLVAGIDGMPRHLAMHPCGILLADTTLRTRTPIQRSAHGHPVSQFDKDDVAALGLLKLDVLGVRMLSAMRHCVDLVNGVTRDPRIVRSPTRPRPTATDPSEPRVPGWEAGPFTLDVIAHDDPATYALIRSTHSVGMFQIESPGQRELLGRLQPTRFADLIAEISLFRPGPMRSDMVTPYVARRHGEEATRFEHPAFEPVLGETYGVIVYHEQVMGVLRVLTGCDAAYADLLRRRLGDPTSLRLVRRWVSERAQARGFTTGVIERVFEDVAAFAAFGFCKAHAAAFAVPTERSAFLKTHLFPEFMAGVLTHDPGMYPLRMLVEECRLFGVPVLAPDLNRAGHDVEVEVLDEDVADAALGLIGARAAWSAGEDPARLLPAGWTWPAHASRPLPPTGLDHGGRTAGTRWALRLGLAGLVGLSGQEVDGLLALRPFASVADLRARAGLTRPSALALVDAGALDQVARVGLPDGPRDRRALHLSVAEAWTGASRRSRSGARSRRAQSGGPDQPALELGLGASPAALPPQPRAARVRAELHSTGVELSGHVVGFYAPLLTQLGVVSAHAFRDVPTGQRVRVAGVRVALQSPPQRSGQRVLFLTLDDRTGQVQATFFARALPDCAWVVRHAELVVVEGIVARRGRRGATLVAHRAWDLTRLWEAWQAGRLDAAWQERGTPAPHARVAPTPPSGRVLAAGGSAGAGGR